MPSARCAAAAAACWLFALLPVFQASGYSEDREKEAGSTASNPFVGTWVCNREAKIRGKEKTIPLTLVIRESGGVLQVKYQLSHGKKVFTSDWNGACDFELERGVKCYHKSTFRYAPEENRIYITTEITYGGTVKEKKSHVEGYYALEEGGGRLVHRTTLFRSEGKELSLPGDMVYERGPQ